MSGRGRGDQSRGMACRTAPIQVFIADASLPVRQRVHALLAAQGLHVAGEAATPQECIAAVLRAPPDVVVLDVQLAGGSGLQVLEACRKAAPDVAFVVFSNDAATAYRTRYLAAGAACFLDKSSEFDQLARAVQAASRLRFP